MPLTRCRRTATFLGRAERHAAAIATAEELAQFLQVERSQRWPDATPHGLDVYATEIRSAEILRWLLRLSEVRRRECASAEQSVGAHALTPIGTSCRWRCHRATT